MTAQTSNSAGFTLTELIIVTALVAIMAVTAIPGLINLLDGTQNRSEVNDLFSFLASARAEAVRSGSIHTLCPLDPVTGSCSQNWDAPLQLFRDPFNERKLTENTHVVRLLPPPKRGRIQAASLSRSYFQYRPDGQIFSDLGNITWCPESGDAGQAAHIIISRGGRVRLATDRDNDGIVEKANGQPVTCDV